MGNTAKIYGFIDDDYNSNDTLLNHIELRPPNVSIYSYYFHYIIVCNLRRDGTYRYGVFEKRIITKVY